METETVVESDSSRPRDDEIQAYHNQIRAADAEKLEFVGEKVSITEFRAENFHALWTEMAALRMTMPLNWNVVTPI